MELDTVYQQIFQAAKPYLAKGRFWDLWHTELSIADMQKILEEEGLINRSNVFIPAIILHDTGWSTVGEEKNDSWGNRDLRITHMAASAVIAKKILEDLHYDPELIPEILDLVAHHDDAYLGLEPKILEQKIIRDADACFILSYPSFWKDVVKHHAKDASEFLDQQVQKYGKRYTKTAQSITDEQIKDRLKEIQNQTMSIQKHYDEVYTNAKKKNEDALTN